MSEHHNTSQRWVGLVMVHRSVLGQRARAVGASAPSADSHAEHAGGAERVEREIASAATSAEGDGVNVDVDLEELTDRVYQLFVDQLVRERDRAAWVG